jgi:protein TonB
MPAELLRDVTQSSRSIPTRRLSVLPVSIAAHAAAAIAFLIIPLAAEVELPPLMPHAVADYMLAKVQPPPPPPAPIRGGERGRAPSATGIPIVAPNSIAQDRPVPAIPPGAGVIGGIESDSGIIGGLGPTIAIEPPPPAPVKTPATPTPVRPGGDIREPKKIVDVPLVYPALARAGNIEGIVILEAVINVRGEVERLRVLRSVPLLDGAALDAVQRWRYTPTLLNGVPVPVLITITVRFSLR